MKYIKHSIISYDGSQESIYIMRADGLSFARVYFFPKERRSRGYLDSLSVHKSIRKHGEGMKLQIMRESIIRGRGLKYSFLWVVAGTWMEKWYERRGYKFWEKHSTYKGCNWMRKKL